MYSQKIRIRYSETDSSATLSMGGLVNILQDMATFNSEDIGYGTLKIMSMGLGWFLTNYSIKINRLPKLCETVTVNTMPYSMKKMFGLRAFEMLDETGATLLTADSTWVLMDAATGKPTVISDEMSTAYALDEKPDVQYSNPRFKAIETAAECGRFTVSGAFIDTNGHMNNAYYVDIMSRYLPREFSIEELIINYKKPALLGDEVVAFMAPLDGGGYQVRFEIDAQLCAIAEFR